MAAPDNYYAYYVEDEKFRYWEGQVYQDLSWTLAGTRGDGTLLNCGAYMYNKTLQSGGSRDGNGRPFSLEDYADVLNRSKGAAQDWYDYIRPWDPDNTNYGFHHAEYRKWPWSSKFEFDTEEREVTAEKFGNVHKFV